MLGVTKLKREVKKATGISTIQRYTDPNRIKQAIKQDVGIYGNPTITVIRQATKGKLPSIVGLFSKLKFW